MHLCTVREQCDLISNYFLNVLTTTQHHVALTGLTDVLDELLVLCKYLSERLFNYNGSISICQAKVYKLRSQYRGKQYFWSKELETVVDSFDGDEETYVIVRFIELLCDHLDADFRMMN